MSTTISTALNFFLSDNKIFIELGHLVLIGVKYVLFSCLMSNRLPKEVTTCNF